MATNRRKVFLSHRSVDKPRVLAIAERLIEAGIDAWVGDWEILPGDSFVAKINQGLEECDAGLVFLSRESLNGNWHQTEIESLTVMTVEEDKPLIPVLLDRDAQVPPLLRQLSRLAGDQIEELIDAINGRTGKPKLGQPRAEPARKRFVIRVRNLPDGKLGISGEGEDNEVPVTPGADFQFSYADFLRNTVPFSRLGGAAEAVGARDRELRNLGDAIGRVVFPGGIGKRLAESIDEAARLGGEIELVFEAHDEALDEAHAARSLAIPFEAARLPDGRAPALLPGVFVWRRQAGKAPSRQDPAGGPLRILVAVGAPDEGKTAGAVLRTERELQTILDALDRARALGNAHVRILEVGSLDEIGKALRERSYHVLHLSGHGNAGSLELEDEDGNPQKATAADLAQAVRESGHAAPLIFLASCHGGVTAGETSSLAHGLLTNGVPAVLAMQTSVSDWYATELAGKFYGELALAERPFASRALSLARRELEAARHKKLARGEFDDGALAEFATPSLFLSGEERAAIDRGLPLQPVEEPAPPSTGAVPLLKIGELIGRRRESREIVRVLTGRRAGCQILGSGGVGKSTLAGRVMQRMADRGWRIVTVGGKWSLGTVAMAMGAALWNDSDNRLAKAARALADEQAPDPVRLPELQRILTHHEVLLVFDNFEDNLALTGVAFHDTLLPSLFQSLLSAAQCGKILVTSRYPLPGLEEALHTVELGPLSRAETRKLMLRLEGLKSHPAATVRLIERAIGGHPRTLEYLDALLRHGAATDRIAQRLRVFARDAGVSLDGPIAFDQKLADAARVAAADAMLDELIRVIKERPRDLEALWQASVYPAPVAAEAASFGIADSELPGIVERLAASSLLLRTGEREVFVHRWTAEALKARMGADVFRSCARRAAEFLERRNPIESIRLFLAAGEFERGSGLAQAVIGVLEPRGQTRVWTELAREVGEALPDTYPDKNRFIGTEGDGLRQLGLAGQAMNRYQAKADLAERLAAGEPDRADYQRDLSVSYNKMGDLLRALGQGETARQFYQKDLEIAERLAAGEPVRADYQRDLWVSYNKMGDLLRALGQGETARQFYQTALEIAERLAAGEPDRADYQRDLSFSYNNMGDLLRALGQGETARQFYQKSLEIRERLTAGEPDRADYQRDLWVSYNKMGDLRRALGRGETARQFYRKSLEIAERLAAGEPDRADYQRDLSVSYIKMGDLLRALGQGETARQFYQKALDIVERLAAGEPDRADYQRDLSVSHERMGDLLRALGQSETARQFYQKSLEIRERLTAGEPDRADYQRDLSVSYNKMGDLLRALGQGETARQFYQKDLEIAERLAAGEPDRADYQRDLSVSCNNMGDLLRALGQGETARQFYRKSLEIRERLAAGEPDRADYSVDLVKSLARTGDKPSLQRALQILSGLSESGRLDHNGQRLLQYVQQLIG